MPSFFFREIKLITVLLLLCDSYMSWSTRLVSIKLMWDFPFLIPFSSSLYFCSSKCMDSLTLERHNSFQNENNIKATHSFTSRPRIFKFQQEVLKFNYTSWVGAPQNWHGDKSFKPRKSKFWKRQFSSSTVTFK